MQNLVVCNFDGHSPRITREFSVGNDRDSRSKSSSGPKLERRRNHFRGHVEIGMIRIPYDGPSNSSATTEVVLSAKQQKVGQPKVLFAKPRGKSATANSLNAIAIIKCPPYGTVETPVAWRYSKGEWNLLPPNFEVPEGHTAFVLQLEDGAAVMIERRGSLETAGAGRVVLVRVGQEIFFQKEDRIGLIPVVAQRLKLAPPKPPKTPALA